MTVALSEAIVARAYPRNFKNYKIGLQEWLPFQTEIRSSDLLDGLGWERLKNFRLKQLAVLVYKIHHNLSPLYLKKIFNYISTIDTHNLENSESNSFLDQELNMSKVAYILGALFCGTESCQRSDTLTQFEQFQNCFPQGSLQLIPITLLNIFLTQL